MNTECNDFKITKNGAVWIAIFILTIGFAYITGMANDELSKHFLFAAALAWSAFCSMGYSISEWFLHRDMFRHARL